MKLVSSSCFILLLTALTAAAQSRPTTGSATAPTDTRLSVISSRLVAPAAVHVQGKLLPGEMAWWDFGDPTGAYNNSTATFYAHVYDKPGTYRLALTIFDSHGAMQMETREIIVQPDARRAIFVSSSDGNDSSPGTIDQPVKTLAKAAQLLKNDGAILLKRGEKFESNQQITLNQFNIRIGDYGDAKDRAVIHFRDNDWKTVFLLSDKASEVTIENINFDLRSKNFAVEMNSSQTTIRNCDVLQGGGLVVAKNVAYLLLDNCANAQPTDRGLIYAGGVNVPNLNVIIRRCWSAGSKYEHCVRIHNTRGLLVQDCVMDNSTSAQGKQALNLRDGGDFHVVNSKIIGPCVFGPLADKTGGLYDEPGAERERKLNLRLDGLSVFNCSFDGYAILEAGLNDFVFQDCWIRAKSGGACFQIQKDYGPRSPASGIFRRVGAFYPGGKLVSGPMKEVRQEQTSIDNAKPGR